MWHGGARVNPAGGGWDRRALMQDAVNGRTEERLWGLANCCRCCGNEAASRGTWRPGEGTEMQQGHGGNDAGMEAGHGSEARGRGGAVEVPIEVRRHGTGHELVVLQGKTGKRGRLRQREEEWEEGEGNEQFLLGFRRGCARGRRRCTKMEELRFLPIWTSSEAAGAKT